MLRIQTNPSLSGLVRYQDRSANSIANFESDNCPIRGLKYPHIGQFVLLQEILTFQEIKVIETNFNGSYFVPLGQKTGENAGWDLYFSEI
jgi:hypothetical protein